MNKNNSSGCSKSGIKIHKSDNDYKKDPFININLNNYSNNYCNINSSNTSNCIDLNIDNYSREDLYKLFKQK